MILESLLLTVIAIIGIMFLGMMLVISIATVTLAAEEQVRRLRLEIKDWSNYYDYLESKKI